MHKYNTKFTRAFLQGACISMLSIVLQNADLRAIGLGFAALGLAYAVGRMDSQAEHAWLPDALREERDENKRLNDKLKWSRMGTYGQRPRGSYPRGE